MTKKEFYQFIEKGELQGACRYFEYWFVYKNISSHSRVLEIGAGKSMLASAIVEKDCNVYVTDIDPEAIKFQLKQGIISECTDNLDSYGDGMFDVVVNASAIEHFMSDVDAIKQVSRVLKRGGLFINTLPVGENYISNYQAGYKQPITRIYDKKTYTERFLQDFIELDREFYTDSNQEPTDFIPHDGWRAKNFKKAFGFGENVGLCVVLQKKI